MTTAAVDARAVFLDDYGRLHRSLAGAERPWLAERRARAIDRFAEIGFPGAKNEDWKYTSVAPLLRQRYRPSQPLRGDARERAARDAIARAPGLERDRGDLAAVFVNGRFVAPASDTRSDQALELADLAGVLLERGDVLARLFGSCLDPGTHGFAALNAAFAVDGAFVHVKQNVERPIHVLHVCVREDEPYVVHPRNLIVLEPGASACVVEHWLGENGVTYLANAASEILLGRDASLRHVKVQHEGESGYHVHRIEARLERASSLVSHSVALGAALSRTEIHAELAGEGAECALYGLYVASGRRHVDHHTTIDHAVARTNSRELYKGILDDHARGVFTGKVIVRPQSQQTCAEQTNRNLLLAPGAVVETRPQLEIYADDVKCSHGAAVGRLDEDALFYMRQRGIDHEQARSLLTYAFGSEVLDKLGSEALRRALEKAVLKRIHKHADGMSEAELEGVIA